MSQKLPVNRFNRVEGLSEFDESFIKSYDEESDEGCFLEVDVQCSEKLHDLHNDIPFLPERMKVEKVKKPIANLRDKTEYVIYIKNLIQALNHGLVLKKNHRVIKFNQKAWLKPYIDMNTNLRKKQKMTLSNIFSS